MPTDLASLRDRAIASYERGRLRQALGLLWVVVPLVALSCAICGQPQTAVLLGAALAVSVVFFDWRGLELGRGARLGLMAGAAGFVLPVVFHLTGLCCRLGIETAICILSGVAAGILVVSRAKTVERLRRTSFMLAGGWTAALVGSLGCAFLGLGGVLSVVGGVALVTAPVILLSQLPA